MVFPYNTNPKLNTSGYFWTKGYPGNIILIKKSIKQKRLLCFYGTQWVSFGGSPQKFLNGATKVSSYLPSAMDVQCGTEFVRMAK